MSELEYTVKIDGPGLSLERVVPKDVGERVVVLLLTGAALRPSNPQPMISTSSDGSMKIRPDQPQTPVLVNASGQSLREFINSVEAKRVPDKITAFGAYLKDARQQESFGRTDLIQCFEEAAEKVPLNLFRDIQWALKSGWIAPKSGQKDLYYVTNSGSKAVEERFSLDVIRKTRGLTSGIKRNGGKAPESEVGAS